MRSGRLTPKKISHGIGNKNKTPVNKTRLRKEGMTEEDENKNSTTNGTIDLHTINISQ